MATRIATKRTTQTRRPTGARKEQKRSRSTRRKRPPVTGTATLTSKGQITIPKMVRDFFPLRPGDQIRFIEDDRGFRIVRHFKESPFKAWRGYLKDLAGQDVDDLIDEMRGR